MIILRSKLFGIEKDNNVNAILGAGAGGALMMGTKKAGRNLAIKLVKDVNGDIKNAEESKAIYNKLKQHAKDKKVGVVEDELIDAYQGSEAANKIRKYYTGKIKKLRKAGKNKEAEQIMDSMDAQLPKGFGKNTITITDPGKADVLAHELGHQYYIKNKKAGFVGKYSHNIGEPFNILSRSKGTAAISLANGIHSGMKKEKNKKLGKKTNIWDKTKSVAVPAALTAPLLISEGMASKKGLKLMKEAGASEKLLKESKNRLSKCWGTYASGNVAPAIAAGAGGELIGRGIGKIKYQNSKERKKNDNTKK